MTDVLLRLNSRLTAAAAPACASSNLVIRRTCSRADPATRDGARRSDPLLFTLTSAPGPSLTAARACPPRGRRPRSMFRRNSACRKCTSSDAHVAPSDRRPCRARPRRQPGRPWPAAVHQDGHTWLTCLAIGSRATQPASPAATMSRPPTAAAAHHGNSRHRQARRTGRRQRAGGRGRRHVRVPDRHRGRDRDEHAKQGKQHADHAPDHAARGDDGGEAGERREPERVRGGQQCVPGHGDAGRRQRRRRARTTHAPMAAARRAARSPRPPRRRRAPR